MEKKTFGLDLRLAHAGILLLYPVLGTLISWTIIKKYLLFSELSWIIPSSLVLVVQLMKFLICY